MGSLSVFLFETDLKNELLVTLLAATLQNAFFFFAYIFIIFFPIFDSRFPFMFLYPIIYEYVPIKIVP